MAQARRVAVRSVLLAHEQIRIGGGVRLASHRGFGLGISALLAILAVPSLLRTGTVRWPAFAGACCALFIALLRPNWLGPVHRGWFRLALLLQAVINPLVLTTLYLGLFTPVAWLRRLFGHHPALQLRPDPGAGSYWLKRQETGVGASMRRLF